MPTALPTDVRQFVDNPIASGAFRSEEEVLIAAARVLRELSARHEALRSDIQKGISSLDSEEGTALNMVEIKNKLSQQVVATASAS